LYRLARSWAPGHGSKAQVMSIQVPVRFARWDWSFIAAHGFLLACLTMGGGAAVGFLSDVVVQLLAICWSPCSLYLSVLVDIAGAGAAGICAL
jgi:hypothetical protein